MVILKTFEDFFEKHKIYFSILIVVPSVILCLYVPLKSFRNLTSDAITISSILFAILGLFLGIIISLAENSTFFQLAQKYDLKENIIHKITKDICLNIYLNIFFIIVTLIYDIAPSMNVQLIKKIADAFWMSFFMLIIFGTIRIVHIISRIYLFDEHANNGNERLES